MIELNVFARELAGFVVTDCLVATEDTLFLLAVEDYTQWTDWQDNGDFPGDEFLEKRLIQFAPSFTESERWQHASLQGMDISSLGIAYRPETCVVVADMDGVMYVISDDGSDFEKKIPYDKGNRSRRGSIQKLKTIDDVLYLCGGNRIVAERRGKNDWKWMTSDIPLSKEEREGLGLSVGFRDIAGFSQKDIYAAGAEGDVWHYDGKTWRRIDFPSNDFIFTVCCGGDGQVYIGSHDGVVYRGRGDIWQRLKDPELSLPFKDMLWYEDRLWCTNDYGVWWVEGDEVVEADIPDSAILCSGNLSTEEGVLLLAGLHGAAYLKNGEWNVMFHYDELLEQCREAGKLEGVLRARWHEFTGED